MSDFQSTLSILGPKPPVLTQSTDNTDGVMPPDVALKASSLLQQARQQYPGADQDILQAFIRDNKNKYPKSIAKIQSFMQDNMDTTRAGRNNNVTAMTTDVAQALGLQQGTDYHVGDPFKDSSGKTLYTAQLNGSDPISATVAAFDKAASQNIPIFQTGNGKPRWSYIDMTNQQWNALSPEQKQQTVLSMGQDGEGANIGKGKYSPTQILDSVISDNQNTQAPQQPQDNSGQIVNDGPLHGLATLLGLTSDSYAQLPNLVDTAKSMAEPFAKGLASGIRSFEATPALLSGNAQKAQEIMSEPVLGQKTLEGSTPLQNIGSALNAASDLVGTNKFLPAIGAGNVIKGVTTGATQGLLGGEGQYLTNEQNPTISGGLKAAGQGVLTGAVTGGTAAAIQPFVTDSTRSLEPAKQKTWEVVQPKLTPTEQAAAVKAGSVTTDGLTGKITFNPSTLHDQQMVEVAQPYVSNAKNEIEAITNMQDGIEQQAQQLQNALKDTGATYTKTQLQGAFNQIEENPNLISDPVVAKKADLLQQEALRLAGKGGNLSDLLNVRKGLDSYVNKFYPNLYDSETLAPVKQAVLETREAINNLIDSRLPEGKFSNGTSFRQSLKNQSLLYDAIDNVSSKIPKIGTNTTMIGKATDFAKKSLKGGVGLIPGGEFIKHILP